MSAACFPYSRMSLPYLLTLLTPSHPLPHFPGFLLLWAGRNHWLKITSASLQFGHKFLYSHPSHSFYSLSEPRSEHNLSWPGLCPEFKALFLHLPRCVSIIAPGFYIAMFNSPLSTLYGLSIFLYLKKKIDFIQGCWFFLSSTCELVPDFWHFLKNLHLIGLTNSQRFILYLIIALKIKYLQPLNLWLWPIYLPLFWSPALSFL